jgi:hypothetical protein
MLIVDVVKVGEERAPKCLTDEKESKDWGSERNVKRKRRFKGTVARDFW